MSYTRLAVVIPAFNAMESIEKSITSCIDLLDCQVIVVDDGSEDRTSEIAEANNALVVRQENAGAAVARRRGLSVCDSEYVIFLDADDELVPAGVVASLKSLDASSGVAVAAGRILGVWPHGKEAVLPRSYDEVTVDALIRKGYGPWPPAAAVIRRTALEAADALPIPVLNTGFAEDYEMMIRLALVGKVTVHESAATRYRLYVGKSSSAPVRAIQDKETIRSYYASALSIDCSLMTHREVDAASKLRACRTAAANRRFLTAGIWLIRATLSSPRLIIGKIKSFLVRDRRSTGPM